MVSLVALVLLAFDDIVFRNLDQILAGLPTGVPNRDSLVVLFPFFEHFIESLARTGSLDPWNPYVWGGSPAIGNPNIPFNLILYAFFHLSRPAFVVAMNWHLVAEFAAAAVGVFLLMRRLGHAVAPAFVAAVLSVCSTSALWMTNTFCIFFHWVVIPWALWLLLTAPRRPLAQTVIFLAGLFYYQLTYGQAQMTLYTLFFVLLCIVWLLREAFDRTLALKALAGGVVLGACLALHFLLPMAEYLSLAGDRSTETWAQTASHYLVDWRYLLNLFLPRLFWDPLPWWPVWRDGWSPWESFNVSIGPFFGMLAIWGWATAKPGFARRMGIFAIILIGLVTTEWGGRVLVALNLGRTVPFSRVTHLLLYPLLFGVVSAWRTDGRALGGLAVCFGAAGLFGILLSRDFGTLVKGLFASAASAGHYAPERASTLAHQFIHAHRDAFTEIFLHDISLLASGAVLIGAAYFLYHRPRLRVALLSIAVLIPLADQAEFFSSHRQRGTQPYPFARTLNWDNPLIAVLRARAADFDRFLFSTFTGRMELDTGLAPNQNASLKIPSINGYTSFNHYRDSRFHRGNWGYAFSEEELKRSGVKYILLGPETPKLDYAAKLKPLAQFREYRLVEFAEAVPRYRFLAVPADCSATVKVEGTTAILENSCSQPLSFVFPQFHYPWWRATLDGQAVSTEEPALVPSGLHRFELKCVPVTWYAGLIASWLTFGAVLIKLISALPRKERFLVHRPIPA